MIAKITNLALQILAGWFAICVAYQTSMWVYLQLDVPVTASAYGQYRWTTEWAMPMAVGTFFAVLVLVVAGLVGLWGIFNNWRRR